MCVPERLIYCLTFNLLGKEMSLCIDISPCMLGHKRLYIFCTVHLLYMKIYGLFKICLCSFKRSRKFQPEDRLLSLSSVTSPAVEELAAGRDDGRSDFCPGRSKGGGIHANGQGKPKKGMPTPRHAKRNRASSEQDFDYDDDPELTF